MSRNSRILSAALACTLALGASSGAMARGGGHMASPQHSNGPVYSSGEGKAVAAKSVNVGGLSKFVLSNAIKGGKLVGGALKTLGSAMAGSDKCPGGYCGPQL